MSQLSVNDIVNVNVVLNPLVAALRNFGSLLIIGSTPGVIDTTERIRSYSTLTGVTNDFGGSAPEALAATKFFGQTPQPSQLYIGVFAQAATSGRLVGGVLSTAQQALSNFTAVSSGDMDIIVDGTSHTITAINLSGAANLNAVAALVTAGFSGAATVTWNANSGQFYVTSATTGTTSSVAFATAPGSGTDIGALMNLESTQGGYSAPGNAVETPLAGVEACAAASGLWYAVEMAPVSSLQTSDITGIAGFILAESPARIHLATTSDPNSLNASSTTDIAYLLSAGKFQRSCLQYSSSTPHAIAAFFGIAATVDFEGSNTTITMKFKQENGVTAENLTESQAAALNGKNCNVYANYTNSQAMLQQGVMCDGTFFDTLQGTDWLQNACQAAVLARLQTMPKIPQTDAGINDLCTALTGVFEQAIENGLGAPGVWNGPPIGALQTGQTLSKGYYIYAQPVASQSQAARSARQAPTIQAAFKLAGAVHSVDVVINVNN
ncbi:DUF3383 domain-containing protein [Dyella mobilis]|uniref:DUF3383 domain-containing protein n=1 Tax=Dyella mobilis TaxID=1849582 RepID=A0ABS2KKW3_9GAMM|nr:DUF3383 domain-containing protein [Dyella mobilis]MBM7131554.1 DUF3383 domain-containing protein [Dyella mobilis]GLQ96475.1 hypothetical protein GCM10007863_08930 [Dyella mobilis]